jgi:hypothetical protein
MSVTRAVAGSSAARIHETGTIRITKGIGVPTTRATSMEALATPILGESLCKLRSATLSTLKCYQGSTYIAASPSHEVAILDRSFVRVAIDW